MDLRVKPLIFSVALSSIFLAYAPIASANITTCPGEPARAMNWSSSGCSGSPSISSQAFGCQVTSPPSSGSVSIPNGTACTATITCANGGGNASAQDTITYDPSLVWNGSACVPPTGPPPPPPTPVINVSWNPTSIPYNGNSTISWSTSNATYCDFWWNGSYIGNTNSGYPLQNSGWTYGPLSSSATWTMSCSGSGGTRSASATVSVASPPTNNASCTSISAPASVGKGATFAATVIMNNNGTTNWTQSGQYKLGANQPWDTMTWGLNRVLLPVSSVAPGQNATFNFNATAPSTPGTYTFSWHMLQEGVQWFGNDCSQTISVTGGPSATISASPNPCTVALGANTCSTNVTWNISSAPNPNLFSAYTNTVLSNAASGSNLPATAAYSGTAFSARNSSSVLNSVTVGGTCAAGSVWNGSICGCTNGTNNPPACSQCPNGLAYLGGTCTACSNGGCSGPGGSSGTPLGSLVCNNGASNPVSCSAPSTPTATLSANPTTVVTGQSSTLSWSSTNATSCTAVGGFSTGGATAGSASTGPLTSTQNYQISCTGAGGSVNSNIATVTVLQPTTTLTASPSRVHAGQSSTIAWSSTNVTSCTVTGPGVSASTTSGSRSIAVTSQSVYTLTCQTAGSPITKTVTVNIIPDFQEF